MVAFGGLFCIRVPVQQALGCAFNPAAVKTFFRKERKNVAYTVHKNKLVLKDGKETLRVGCVPAEDMVTLDVVAPVKAATLDLKLLKYISDVIDPANVRPWSHGVDYANGMLAATNNAVIIAAYVELPSGLAFNIHKDACAALAKFKSPVVGIASDSRATKFVFEDKSEFTVLNLSEKIPDFSSLFKRNWLPLGMSDDLVEDLMKIDCHSFLFNAGCIFYQNEDKSSIGELQVKLAQQFTARTMKNTFGFILRNGGKISVDDSGTCLRSVNEDVCVITSLMAEQ